MLVQFESGMRILRVVFTCASPVPLSNETHLGDSACALVNRRLRHDGCESFNVIPGRLHAAAALEIGLPLRGLGQRFLRIFIESLGHNCDQITHDSRMVEQRFNDRMRELSRRRIVNRNIESFVLGVWHLDICEKDQLQNRER
jgi:hypothetical protein